MCHALCKEAQHIRLAFGAHRGNRIRISIFQCRFSASRVCQLPPRGHLSVFLLSSGSVVFSWVSCHALPQWPGKKQPPRRGLFFHTGCEGPSSSSRDDKVRREGEQGTQQALNTQCLSAFKGQKAPHPFFATDGAQSLPNYHYKTTTGPAGAARTSATSTSVFAPGKLSHRKKITNQGGNKPETATPHSPTPLEATKPSTNPPRKHRIFSPRLAGPVVHQFFLNSFPKSGVHYHT